MSFSKKGPIIVPLIFSVGLCKAGDYLYQVKKGDTLSSVLYSKNIGPIYGKHGALSQILKLNPQLKARGNKIFPGTTIHLGQLFSENPMPEKTEDKLDDQKIGEANQEVISTIETENNDRATFFKATPFVSWKSLNATEENIYRRSNISAISGTNYGASLTYGKNFRTNYDWYSSMAIESVHFSHKDSISLNKQSFVSSRFAVGAAYEKKWSLEAAASDQFYLTSPHIDNVIIKKVTVPEFKLAYEKDFYEFKKAQFYYAVSAKVLMPGKSGDLETNMGHGYGGAIEGKSGQHAFKVGYDLNLLKASGNSTHYQNIYWQYIWENL